MRTAHPRLSALLGACALLAATAPVHAESAIDVERARGDRHDDDERDSVSGGGGSELPPYLQCVPYARQVSGIQIRGDAWTWWSQAEGRYARGNRPRVGAVMTFQPYGRMELGHVAAVSRIVDSRTVLLRHANWSPINGRRGQIEDNVRAVDVSPDNDWSQVRVWFAPIQNLGSTAWPVQGFIYPKRIDQAPRGTRVIDSVSDPIGAIIAARLAVKR
ncbi:CHAP domain-containing protein [Novosphingobium flavum]|uniref:CHAP domain-containing protein n=1 Tax=Novosphingobium aerophilum TaxID=2839843 RepID=UPI00163A8B78|nr:CHAP domain-containing protein [Novosphingobium aerophilum]MBC2663203.1 CHAP domain-containing protein [Novosphingobium aerophilum]